MKTAKAYLRFAAVRGAMLWLLYLGYFGGVEGATHVVIFCTWAFGLLSALATHESVIKTGAAQGAVYAPEWAHTVFHVVLTLGLVWHGDTLTGAAALLWGACANYHRAGVRKFSAEAK